ncbi:MAG: hypothetical protein KDC35_19110 [Acidobacteria bacterium]|nr:hypothetical protein [Acidobacteriota bacterium]
MRHRSPVHFDGVCVVSGRVWTIGAHVVAFFLVITWQSFTPNDLAALMSNSPQNTKQGQNIVSTRVTFDRQDERLFLSTEETYRKVGEPETHAMIERRHIPLDRITDLQIGLADEIEPGRMYAILISYIVDDDDQSPVQFEGDVSEMTFIRTIRLATYTDEEAAIIEIELSALIRSEQGPH